MSPEDTCPNCGVHPFQYFNFGTYAECHVCGTKWKVV